MPYKRTLHSPIGPIIKEKRLRLDMSLSEVARRIDRSKSYLWNIENGNIRSPDFHVVMALCNVLKINPVSLYIATKDPE